jgi:hypothetical protein
VSDNGTVAAAEEPASAAPPDKEGEAGADG